ncbi:MAG: TRAP transporter TatT component family protein [Vicinamibacterales bacterium]|nr:TRAP transporter TatT component family protein [Vicinamibacterales bacterium]HJO18061.1 TRAP transporter TatT component family protein [Vicinamibacterales bacterium]
MPRNLGSLLLIAVLLAPVLSGCSLKTYAINMVGDALAEGDSVYETDDDIEFVGDALPFGLKLTESLLNESPDHRGLLLTACRGFSLYAYAYVDYPSEVAMEKDIGLGRTMRTRARRLYQRALDYCLRGLSRDHRGFRSRLSTEPEDAVAMITPGHEERDLPLLYWTAASLGLAIAASPGSAAMLARLPEVEALLERALELDEGWDEGALHEFKVVVAGAVPGQPDYDEIRRHYDRALELSSGRRAGLHIAYAEAVSVPTQNAAEFREMMEVALSVDPDADPDNRLVNLIAQRRANWLLDRIEDLFLEPGS